LFCSGYRPFLKKATANTESFTPFRMTALDQNDVVRFRMTALQGGSSPSAMGWLSTPKRTPKAQGQDGGGVCLLWIERGS
jgi:hypothetical protein